jgi:uracil-DNA glycosylase
VVGPGRAELSAAMGSPPVVMGLIPGEDQPQMPLPEERKAGTSPLFDRGAVLVSMAAAIALGATSMSDIAVLAHLAPFGASHQPG